jgi:hypothetical protein
LNSRPCACKAGLNNRNYKQTKKFSFILFKSKHITEQFQNLSFAHIPQTEIPGVKDVSIKI